VLTTKNTDKPSKDPYLSASDDAKKWQKTKVLDKIKTMGLAYEVIFRYLDKIKKTESDYDRDSSSIRESIEMPGGQDGSDIQFDSTHASPSKKGDNIISGSRKNK